MVVVGSIAFAMIHWSNTGREFEDSFTNRPAQVDAIPKKAPFARARREGALATAKRFLRTAVVRERVEESWDLTAPTLRTGYTRESWATEDIPVQPYPVDAARWRVDYSWEDTVGLKVALFPKHGAKVPAAVFDMELTAYGKGKNRRWLVDSWTPASYVGIPSAPLGARPAAAADLVPEEGQLSATWLLLPGAILGLLVLIPILLGLRGWWRGRRAVKRYLSSLQ